MRLLLAFTVLLIFFLLSIERESLKQALLILMPLPFIISVPAVILRFSGLSLGTETFLGFILLTGLGINNGILIFDNLDKSSVTASSLVKAVEKRFKRTAADLTNNSGRNGAASFHLG